VSARPVVAITRKLPDEVERAIAEYFDARLNPDDRPFDIRELQAALASADAVVCTVTDRLTAEKCSGSWAWDALPGRWRNGPGPASACE
jgi:glyoxylate reductase